MLLEKYLKSLVKKILYFLFLKQNIRKITFPVSAAAALPFATSLSSTIFPGHEGKPLACAQTMSPVVNWIALSTSSFRLLLACFELLSPLC